MLSLWTMIAMTTCIGFALKRNAGMSYVVVKTPQGHRAGYKKG